MDKEPNQVDGNSQTLPCGLYIVATPIGNLADITLRALGVLKKADAIACEDSRVTAKLLAHYGISARMMSYHEHNAEQMRPKILNDLRAGKVIALVSDAGTPLISDPGYKLVNEARAEGLPVYPIPGASSVMAALCASGLPTNRFLFAGFLPSKTTARQKTIEELAAVNASLVVFESARRLPDTLMGLMEIIPEREAVIAREITKLYEEFRRGTIRELAQHYAQAGEPKGEVVIVIAPPEEKEAIYDASVETRLSDALQKLSVKEAASLVAKETGLPRQELYTKALELKGRR
jgi:16S rRNA (cytidine1402-2'-O)-methyltransferase